MHGDEAANLALSDRGTPPFPMHCLYIVKPTPPSSLFYFILYSSSHLSAISLSLDKVPCVRSLIYLPSGLPTTSRWLSSSYLFLSRCRPLCSAKLHVQHRDGIHISQCFFSLSRRDAMHRLCYLFLWYAVSSTSCQLSSVSLSLGEMSCVGSPISSCGMLSHLPRVGSPLFPSL